MRHLIAFQSKPGGFIEAQHEAGHVSGAAW